MDLRQSSIDALGRALRSRAITATELAQSALDHARHGAYRTLDRERTEHAARAADALFTAGIDLGPLQGLPVSVKDLYGVPGYPTFAGSPNRLPPRFEAAGPVVERLLSMCPVITGKTNTVEFAFGGLGASTHYPPPRNPWAKDAPRAPGGSSSGAGVSLAEGSAVLALGTDTAGSVRIPASYTGNCALKTTIQRWSTRGIVPLSTTLDTAGILARTIEDLAIGFGVFERGIFDKKRALSSCRFARMDQLFFESCSPGVVEAVDRACAELARAGVSIEAAAWPEVQEAHAVFSVGGPAAVELLHFLEQELPGWRDTLEPNIAARVKGAAEMPALEYLRRRERMRRAATAVDLRFDGIDALIAPTVANTPPRLEDLQTLESYSRENLLSLRNTSIASYLGLTAITLPIGLDAAGMPVGLQLIGRANSEVQLLAIAGAIEAKLGTSRDRIGAPPGTAIV